MSASSGGFKEFVFWAGALLEIAVSLRFSCGGCVACLLAGISAGDLKNNNQEIEQAG
jgi:hypothetical protein